MAHQLESCHLGQRFQTHFFWGKGLALWSEGMFQIWTLHTLLYLTFIASQIDNKTVARLRSA